VSKIALYFSEDQEFPRILDTDHHPIAKIWRIGRSPACDITFNNPAISRTHAALRCRDLGVDDLAVWEIMAVGLNPTYRAPSGQDGAELARNEWTALEDGDRLWFVDRGYGFLCTTEIDETLEVERQQALEEDATAGGPAAPPALPPAPEHPATWASVVKDLALIILNGPEGFPNWLWWLILAVCVMLYVVIKYG
jgi:hypothetical protein